MCDFRDVYEGTKINKIKLILTKAGLWLGPGSWHPWPTAGKKPPPTLETYAGPMWGAILGADVIFLKNQISSWLGSHIYKYTGFVQ